MAHQHPHSHPHHEPSRHFTRPAPPPHRPPPVHTSAAAINPRILDASIRDVAERLSNEQKAEVLLHAMNLLKLANPFSHHIVENGVISCFNAANLSTPQRVQALLLRGRARMASGEIAKARQDLHKVLELVPDHAVATSLLSIPISGSTPQKESRFWTIESASRRLSPELWRQVASFLPRRDLKTLLSLPHVLSRIAFEFVFERIDLHIGVCRLAGEDGARDLNDPDRPGFALEKRLAQRTADIVARIVLDPSFAKLIKTVRISAERRDKSNHMAFRTNMLATALPKLINLREVIFSGSNDVWAQLSEVLSTTHSRLEALTLEPEHDSEPALPHLTHLSQFKLVRDHAAHALPAFLAQNRASLRRLCLGAYYAALPPAPALALTQLTHLEFVGTVPRGSDVFAAIFSRGVNLVSLRLSVVLLAPVSAQFRSAPPDALPSLKRFGFRALETMGAGGGGGVGGASGTGDAGSDSALFPAITEFLRAHAGSLEALELDAAGGEAAQKALGYDASVLGVLPLMTKLRHLAVALTKDASPGLFSWIVPRSLTALLLSGPGVPRRGCETFMHAMRGGLPPGIKYVALLGAEVRDEERFVETALPASVRLVNIGDRFFTVRRRGDRDSPNQSAHHPAHHNQSTTHPHPHSNAFPVVKDPNNADSGGGGGHAYVESLEEWPERRVRLHAEEWLEALGCEDALWDDFAPGAFC